MKTIIVGFSKPIKSTLFSSAIMWSEKTCYDHVYIKWSWSSIGRDIIYQASKFSVNFESNITFDSHAITIEEYSVDISDECHKTIMQFCMDNSNKPYGLKEIFGFVIVNILLFFGKKIKNPFPSNGNTYICSQLGAEILSMTKTINLSYPSSDIDPLILNQIVKASGMKKIK